MYIGRYFFQAYPHPVYIGLGSGVYAIVTLTYNGDYKVLYIGRSDNVYRRLNLSHEREVCWKSYNERGLIYLVNYCDEVTAVEREAELIAVCQPACNRIGSQYIPFQSYTF